MLFPTHLVAAYLLGTRWDLSRSWAVAGAALPDLVDKPLGVLGIAELYHSIGHSLLFLIGLSVVIRLGRGGLALWIGWASHLALDAVHMTINGRPGDVRFLGWPLVGHEPAVQLPPLEFLFHYVGTPAFFVEVAIWIAFAAALLRTSSIGPVGDAREGRPTRRDREGRR